MAVRLKDIAADLGVSTVTVSKVLRGGMDIGERTRARVLKRMAENHELRMRIWMAADSARPSRMRLEKTGLEPTLMKHRLRKRMSR